MQHRILLLPLMFHVKFGYVTLKYQFWGPEICGDKLTTFWAEVAAACRTNRTEPKLWHRAVFTAAVFTAVDMKSVELQEVFCDWYTCSVFWRGPNLLFFSFLVESESDCQLQVWRVLGEANFYVPYIWKDVTPHPMNGTCMIPEMHLQSEV